MGVRERILCFYHLKSRILEIIPKQTTKQFHITVAGIYGARSAVEVELSLFMLPSLLLSMVKHHICSACLHSWVSCGAFPWTTMERFCLNCRLSTAPPCHYNIYFYIALQVHLIEIKTIFLLMIAGPFPKVYTETISTSMEP